METVNVILDQPITRGETKIESLQIRKPGPGELRGLTLQDVASIKFDTMIKLLPRVTTPSITEQEVATMDLSDFTACAAEVAGFLLTRAQRQDSPAA